jgi:hypothetical protein
MLDEFIVSDYAKILHRHIFPREEPLASDFRLWHNVIHQLCMGMATLPVSLGRYICPPHIACRWFTIADATTLYHTDDDPNTLSYTSLLADGKAQEPAMAVNTHRYLARKVNTRGHTMPLLQCWIQPVPS